VFAHPFASKHGAESAAFARVTRPADQSCCEALRPGNGAGDFVIGMQWLSIMVARPVAIHGSVADRTPRPVDVQSQ
jgi:hypothetical protein